MRTRLLGEDEVIERIGNEIRPILKAGSFENKIITFLIAKAIMIKEIESNRMFNQDELQSLLNTEMIQRLRTEWYAIFKNDLLQYEEPNTRDIGNPKREEAEFNTLTSILFGK